jgi:hypothetical protein
MTIYHKRNRTYNFTKGPISHISHICPIGLISPISPIRHISSIRPICPTTHIKAVKEKPNNE